VSSSLDSSPSGPSEGRVHHCREAEAEYQFNGRRTNESGHCLRHKPTPQRLSEAQARGLIVSGVTESAMNNSLRAFANDLYGVRKYWYKRLVRSGPNSLAPYEGNPPDRVVQDDDIVIVDLGPIFRVGSRRRGHHRVRRGSSQIESPE
jgi:hypothetical protein